MGRKRELPASSVHNVGLNWPTLLVLLNISRDMARK